MGLTRSIALAMAQYGVRGNAISQTADTRTPQRLPRGLSTALGQDRLRRFDALNIPLPARSA